MSRSKRYVIDSTGNELTDSKTGKKTRIKSFEIRQSGRLQIVHITQPDGGTVKIARHNIDETAWPLGPVDPLKPSKAPKPERPATRLSELKQVGPGVQVQVGYQLSEEQVLELHEASKKIFDITHKLFMAHIVPVRPRSNAGD